jgi:DNA-directed RNA polymerase subunit alpha
MYKNWTNLIRPKAIEIDKEALSDTYGKFVCEPLERGYGITIGNSLRRILLASIRGAAIVSVRFEGVLHEFSTISDVKEDVADIILNLKEVELAMTSEETKVLRIDADDEGEVVAGDIIRDATVTVLNPDHHIATLTGKGRFQAELIVKKGVGYVPADRNKDDNAPVGTIPMDAIFSPIRKVNYKVTNARVGQITDYDKLTMEIWTNGSVTPQAALGFAAKILKEQLQIFINFDETAVHEEEEVKEHAEVSMKTTNENLYKTIDELELSVRSANCLHNAGIKYIGELVQKTESDMLKTKNFGRKSLKEIKELLSDMGLSLGMKLDGFDSSRKPSKGV